MRPSRKTKHSGSTLNSDQQAIVTAERKLKRRRPKARQSRRTTAAGQARRRRAHLGSDDRVKSERFEESAQEEALSSGHETNLKRRVRHRKARHAKKRGKRVAEAALTLDPQIAAKIEHARRF